MVGLEEVGRLVSEALGEERVEIFDWGVSRHSTLERDQLKWWEKLRGSEDAVVVAITPVLVRFLPARLRGHTLTLAGPVKTFPRSQVDIVPGDPDEDSVVVNFILPNGTTESVVCLGKPNGWSKYATDWTPH